VEEKMENNREKNNKVGDETKMELTAVTQGDHRTNPASPMTVTIY
jgi:hypothetical protein